MCFVLRPCLCPRGWLKGRTERWARPLPAHQQLSLFGQPFLCPLPGYGREPVCRTQPSLLGGVLEGALPWHPSQGKLSACHSGVPLAATVQASSPALRPLCPQGPEHICSSCISPCGSWIAYSTASRLHLHRVRWENSSCSIKRVCKVPKWLCSAHQLLCSADSTRLFVASDQGTVHVLKLLEPGGCKHLQTLRPNSGGSEAVYLLAASADGDWLAAAGGDWKIHIYSLRSFKPRCTVPAYSCAVTALAIHPATNNLVIAHSDQQVFEFSIPDREYTAWSRKVQRQGLHKDWLERDTPITHITFNPKQPAHILLHDTYMFCILDKSLPLPDDATPLMNQTTLKQLSEKARRGHAHAFKICKKYQPLLFVDLLEEGCLVVVERPLMDIKTQLPPPVQQKKFGT